MTDKTTIQEGTLSSDAVMAQQKRLSKVQFNYPSKEVSAVIGNQTVLLIVAGLRSYGEAVAGVHWFRYGPQHYFRS